MEHSWQHSDLGRFEYEWTGWVRTFQLPAFEAFQYRYDGKHIGTPDIPIRFDEEDEDDPQPPSSGAISVAQLIIENQQALAEKSIHSLWLDLNGEGPESGMWWHGELKERDGISHFIPDEIRSAIAEPIDLHRFLGGVTIAIRDSVYRFDKPCATIDFEAAFDVEHGAGVLTDGRTVLGTGYGGGDAGPYEDPDMPSEDG